MQNIRYEPDLEMVDTIYEEFEKDHRRDSASNRKSANRTLNVMFRQWGSGKNKKAYH